MLFPDYPSLSVLSALLFYNVINSTDNLETINDEKQCLSEQQVYNLETAGNLETTNNLETSNNLETTENGNTW